MSLLAILATAGRALRHWYGLAPDPEALPDTVDLTVVGWGDTHPADVRVDTYWADLGVWPVTR